MITILCYSKCGTCKKAEKWLKDNGIDYQYRSITDEKPSADELKKWFVDTNFPINRWFNTSGILYREHKMKDKIKTATTDELIDILASDGMFIKRPILLANNQVTTGFKEEEWKDILG